MIFFVSCNSVIGEKSNMYKSLKENVASENYQITRLKDTNLKIPENADWTIKGANRFFLRSNVWWDTKRNQFLVSGSLGYSVKSDGSLERCMPYTTSFPALEKIAEYPEYQIGAEDIIINLKNEILKKKLSLQAILDRIDVLYAEADVFQGNEYHYYFYVKDKWYYLSPTNYALGEINGLEKAFKQRYNSLYKKKGEEHILNLEGLYGTQYGFDQHEWKGKNRIVHLDSYKKIYTENAPFISIPVVSEGEGFFSLHHRGEILKFKFKTRKFIYSFSKYWTYIDIYFPPDKEKFDSAILSISDPNDHDDLNGLYLIHPRKN